VIHHKQDRLSILSGSGALLFLGFWDTEKLRCWISLKSDPRVGSDGIQLCQLRPQP